VRAARSDDDLLARAIAAIGGGDLLRRVKALNWEAGLSIFTSNGFLNVTARTRFEPFGTVRSESWLADKGPATTLVMTLAPGGDTLTRDGTTGPLDPMVAAHERQQFGLYGYMLLVHAQTRIDGQRLTAERSGYPPISFALNADASLRSADYAVANPTGTGVVAQQFQFVGTVSDQGLTWPRTIALFQNETAIFNMSIKTFSVELS